MIALEGLGRYDHGLVGDLGLVKLLASLRGRPVEAGETAELLAPYGEWQGLAGQMLMLGWSRGLIPGGRPDAGRRARLRTNRAACIAPRARSTLARWRSTSGESPSSAPGRSARRSSPGCSRRAGASRPTSSPRAGAPSASTELAERHGIVATLSNDEAVAGAALVVIAVKPQDIEALLGEIGHLITADQTVLSIAAAIPTATIERHLAPGVPVVRAMPNTPSVVHEGVAGLCAGAHADDAHVTLAEEALAHLGAVVRVPEKQMDAVTAVSGSGPAYFALLAEAMIEAGLLLGLSREISTQLVVQTMLGTAKQMRDLRCTRSSSARWSPRRAARRSPRSGSSRSPASAPRS